MNKIQSLAIYDSGLGGLSVYEALRSRFKDLHCVLYADQKNAPYGNKTPEAIYEIAHRAIASVQKDDIHDVLIACNTVSAVCLTQLKEDFKEMRIWGIIDLTTSQVQTQSVCVAATSATVQSKAYELALGNHHTHSIALPELVSMIENLESEEVIQNYLKQYQDAFSNCETLILGCTHYPLALSAFKALFKGRIIDSREPICKFIEGQYIGSDKTSRVSTSGDAVQFKAQIKRLYHRDLEVSVWNL